MGIYGGLPRLDITGADFDEVSDTSLGKIQAFARGLAAEGKPTVFKVYYPSTTDEDYDVLAVDLATGDISTAPLTVPEFS